MSKIKPPGQVCAKVRHGFCFYGDTAFDLNSPVIAVAEKKLSHILHCVGWIPHVSSPRLEKLTGFCNKICHKRTHALQQTVWPFDRLARA